MPSKGTIFGNLNFYQIRRLLSIAIKSDSIKQLSIFFQRIGLYLNLMYNKFIMIILLLLDKFKVHITRKLVDKKILKILQSSDFNFIAVQIMISNPSLIRDNILKSTLYEQIVKVTQVIQYTRVIAQRINQLTRQMAVQANVLQQLKERHFLRLQQMARQKQGLKQELKAKMFLKMTQQQALSGQMKSLQQNCHFLRQNRVKLSEIKAKSNRLTNELEQLQFHQKEAQQEIQRLELKQIYDKKVYAEEQQTVKQLLMLIEAKRREIEKEGKLMAIVSDQVDDKERRVKALKEETNHIQVSIAKMMSTLEGLTSETTKMQAEKQKLKLKLSTISSQNIQLMSQINSNTTIIQQNKHKSTEITEKISTLIEQSNQLNQKVIKTRQHIIHLNTLKNNQKKVNQQLKLKVRELMKIAIDHQTTNN